MCFFDMRVICFLINLLTLCDSAAISDKIASYFVQSGQDHNLTCNSSADLSSFNLIKWYKNRKPIAYLNNQSIINLNSKFQPRTLIIQGKDLVIQNITKNDSGFYKCIIDQENKISISNIQLMVLDKPSTPSVPKVESVTSRSAKIFWTTADALTDTQGPDALTFQIEYKEGKLSEKWVATLFGVNLTRAEVAGLKPYTRYAFRILATNGIGQSDPSPASDPIVTASERPSESVFDMKMDRIGHDFIIISWRPPSPLSLNGPLLGYRKFSQFDEYDLPTPLYRLNVTPLAPSNNGNKVGTQAIWDGITNSILKTKSHNYENLSSGAGAVNTIFGPHPSTHNIGRGGRIPLTTVRISDLKPFSPYHLTVEPFNGLYYGPSNPGSDPICTAPDKPLRSLPLNGGSHLAIRNMSPDGTKLSLTWRSLDDLAIIRGPIIGYKLTLKSYDGLQGVRMYTIEKVDNDTIKETSLDARLHFELDNATAIYSTWVEINAPAGWLNASCLGDFRKSELKPWNVKIMGLKPLSNYSFSLLAYNLAGDGPQSEPLFHATDTKVPGPPLNLTVRHLSSSLGEEDKEKGVPLSPPLLISWAPPAPSLTPSGSSEAGIARYLVEIYESAPPTTGSGIRNRRVEAGLRRPVNTFTVVPDRRNVTQTADSNLHVLVSGVRGRAHYVIRVAAEVPSKLHPNRSLVGAFNSIRHSYLMDGRESLKFPGYSLFGSESDQKPATKYGLAPGDIAKMGLIAGISVSAIFFILGIVMLFTWKRYYTRQKYSFLPYVMSTPPRQTGCAETCMSSAPLENQGPQGISVGKDLGERLNSDCTLIPSLHGLSKQNAPPHRRSSRCKQKCHSSRRHKSIPADFKAQSGSHHARSPSLVTPLISLLQNSVSRHLGRLRRHVVAKGPPPEIRVRKCRRSKGHHSTPAPSAQAHYPYSALALDKSNKNRRSDWLAMIENSDYNHMAPVGIKDWPLFNDLMHAHSDQGFSDQFAQLCRNSATLLLPENNVASNLAANRRKNRYANIFAHDPTRVILLNKGPPARVASPTGQPLGAEPTHNDYINANFIKGYENPRAYIATQGPLTSSISDFWSMIWDYDIHSVIMITNLVERGKIKCDLYWPPEVGTLEKYGDVEVRHLSTEKRAYFTVRTFAVSSSRPSTPSHENSLPSQATIEHGRSSGLDDGNCNLTVAHQQLLQQQQVAPKAFFASPDPRDSFLGCTINDTLSPTTRHSQQREDNHGVMFGRRIVVQYHYTQWPDHGVPRFTLPLLSFIRRCGHAKYMTPNKMTTGEAVSPSACRIESIKGDKRGFIREIKSQNVGNPKLTMCNVGGTSIIPSSETHIIVNNGQSSEDNPQADESLRPLVVHCSAGVGRTGTFFVVDVMLQRMAQRGTLDVYNYLAEIRQQRNYLVQTEEQFIFIHDALTMALAIGNSTLLSATSLETLLEAYFSRTPSPSDAAKPKLLSIASDPHIIIGEGKEIALKVKKNNLDPPKSDWSASAEAIIKGPVRQAKAKVLSIFSVENRPKSAAGLYYAPPTTSIPNPSARPVKLPEPDPLSLQASLILACHKESSPLSLTSPVCSNALKPCNRLKNRCSSPPCGYEQPASLNNADQQRKGEACGGVGKGGGTKTGQHFQSPPTGPLILPSDDWRVPLTPKPTLEGSDYLNASYLEGFYSQKDFIVTQHPTLDTVHNFWQMIWENNCTDIFLLIFPKDTDSEAYLPFWPALESYLSFDCIKVFCLDSKSRNNLDAQSDGLFSIINFSLESDDEDYQLLTKMYICNGDLLPRYLSPTATPSSRIAECQNIFHLARGSSALGDVLACRNLNKFVAALVNVLMRKNKPPLNALSQNLSPVVVIDKFGGFEAASLCILASAYLQYLHDGGHFDLFQMAYIYNTKRPNLFSTQADVVALYTAMAGIITSKVTPALPNDTWNPNTLSITPTLDLYHDDLNKTQLSFNTHNEYVTKMGEKISC